MNVIGSRPDGWWRDRPRAMRELVDELEELLLSNPGDELTVVFDGAPFEIDADRVGVTFASRRGPNAADDDIAELAGDAHTVVTSDADLAARSRAKGALVVGAGAFRRTLDGNASAPTRVRGQRRSTTGGEKMESSEEEQGAQGSEESPGGDFGGEPGTSGESGGGGESDLDIGGDESAEDQDESGEGSEGEAGGNSF